MHWDDPDGWDGQGGGKRVQGGEHIVNPWLIHINVWQNPLQYCKVISLQLKLKKKKKKELKSWLHPTFPRHDLGSYLTSESLFLRSKVVVV